MTIFLSFIRSLSVLGCLVLIMPSVTVAQPSGARGDDFIYRVSPNDTLINISSRFTGTADHWGTLQSLNAVADPYALPIGLELRIPFALIPQIAAQARVTHLVGQALINQRLARLQDTLHEGDVVETHNNSFIAFTLPDASVVAVPPASTVGIERLRTFMNTGLVDIILNLDKGDVESTVAPEGQGIGRYEIRTPVSITGVRGTRLRVRTQDGGTRTEVLSGMAQLGSSQADGPQLGSQQGTVVSPDGTILPAQPLLPAPTGITHDDASRTVAFEPVPGAVAYRVRVAADSSGTQPVWAQTITAPPVQYRTPGSGTWYVLVHAIDAHGLMSDHAVQPVEGRQVLISGFDLNVNNSFGDPIVLSDY